jgi:translation initiation factor IF-1
MRLMGRKLEMTMLTFDEMLVQVTDLVQQQGRVSYRALKRRFDIDEGCKASI